MFGLRAKWHRLRLAVVLWAARWINARLSRYKFEAQASTSKAVIDRALPALRYGVCDKCPLLSKYGFCGKCHCFMPAKVYKPNAKCPIDKW